MNPLLQPSSIFRRDFLRRSLYAWVLSYPLLAFLVYGAEPSLQKASVLYVIKKNETLGEIIHHLRLGPLWGSDGMVKKTWRINRRVIRHEGDLIYAGTVIMLPVPASIPTPAPAPVRAEMPVVLTRTPAAAEAPVTTPSAAPVPSAPVPSPVIEEAPEPDVLHHLKLNAGFGFTTISAQDPSTGAHASLNSGRDLDLSAAWEQGWDPSFTTFEEFGLRSVSFEASANGSKSLAGSSNTPAHASLGATGFLSPRFSVTTSISYGQDLFLEGLNSSAVTITKAPIFSATEQLDVKLYERKKVTTLGLSASGSYYAPASTDTFNVKAGYGYSGFIYIDQKYGSTDQNSFRLTIGYQEREQNTSLCSQSESSVLTGLSFSFPAFVTDKKATDRNEGGQ